MNQIALWALSSFN